MFYSIAVPSLSFTSLILFQGYLRLVILQEGKHKNYVCVSMLSMMLLTSDVHGAIVTTFFLCTSCTDKNFFAFERFITYLHSVLSFTCYVLIAQSRGTSLATHFTMLFHCYNLLAYYIVALLKNWKHYKYR